MRVTDSQFNAVMQRSLMDNNIRLNKVFEQMSTGLRINHLSDDPIAAVRLEGLKRQSLIISSTSEISKMCSHN